jgi:hypothetical protein
MSSKTIAIVVSLLACRTLKFDLLIHIKQDIPFLIQGIAKTCQDFLQENKT